MARFSILTWQFVHYGMGLRKSGEVSMTLQLSVFWVPYVMAFSCVVVVLVTLVSSSESSNRPERGN